MSPARAVLAVYRAAVYSPGKVEADAAILDGVCDRLAAKGWGVERVHEEALEGHAAPAHVLTMANSEDALRLMEEWEFAGARVVNRPEAIRNCYRHRMARMLLMNNVPFPQSVLVPTDPPAPPDDLDAEDGIWVKRGDVHAMEAGDVVFAKDASAFREALSKMRARGVRKALVQEPAEGAVVKFYATADGAFLRAFPDGADLAELGVLATTAAGVLGLEVLGGDVVVGEGGELTLIDVNDWPSFSRCRDEAAEAIARQVEARWA